MSWVLLAEPDEFLQKAADILTDYIIKLRKFLRKYPRPPITPGHTGADLDEDLPEIEESQEWEKLTPEVKTSKTQFLLLSPSLFKEIINVETS